jgi:DNA-binding MarR family transcriptional regulator
MKDMERTDTTTEQKLIKMLMQVNKLGWHQHSVAGCKPSEIRVLFCIRKFKNQQTGEIKVSEISKRLYVTSPTITQLLKGLEVQGLIERRVDTVDRRSIGIVLTKKGENVAQQAMDMLVASMHGLVDYLGEEQSNQLIELLSRVFYYFHEQASMSETPWKDDKEG